MNNIFYLFTFNFLSIVAIIFFLYTNKQNDVNSFSAYYNSEGAFAGFIQKKQSLYRACEFSTNGSILSCSNILSLLESLYVLIVFSKILYSSLINS